MAEIPAALIKGESDLPFITLDSEAPFINEGSAQFQLLHVDVEAGKYVIRVKFAPGTTIQTHRHTGEIYAITNSGSWYYLEYPDDVNTAGSYLFEPAGSIHTLHVPTTNTEDTDVWFVMNGANLNLDKDGNVETVVDAGTMLADYTAICEAMGFGTPDVLGK